MTAALKHLSAAVLFVTDLAQMKAFYRDILGLPLQFEDEHSAAFDLDGTPLILLSTPGAQDLLSPEAVPLERPSGAHSQLVSFVDDVDAVYADLVTKGVEFIRAPVDREWGLRTAHFEDPEGNVWEIAQPMESRAASPS
ncbi:MAG TPA: VOC family protein [Chloroflexota bacterium]|nr:VOC family protein [Chloroflexota bacterium]